MVSHRIDNKGKARLFKSDFLELLTKAPPLLIWSMYLPVILYLPYYAATRLGFSPAMIACLFVSGMFFWTFFEYVAHRFAFHAISERPGMQRFIYVLHGNHHTHPRDRNRLFMPPVPSVLIASFLFSVMFLIGGQYAYAFFPGFMLGYLLYASTHYAIHAWSPPFKWMKPLWRNHHLHHYKNEHKGFGVSTTLWDRFFGTMFDLKKEPEDKEKVRDLLFDPRK